MVRGRRPAMPGGVSIYAIGDIHGRLDLLDELFALIDEDLNKHPSTTPTFVFLGDYIDRGPSSHQTVDRLIAHGEVNRSIFLKGNHEEVLLKCLRDSRFFKQWIRIGGLQTMMSYDLTAQVMRGGLEELRSSLSNNLPHSHLNFFQNLQSSYLCGDYFFVHAGVKPTVEITRQQDRDMLWIRDEFLLSETDYGKIIIHGHTPAEQVDVRPNRINIDTGAWLTNRLTCLVLQEDSVSIIDTN